jgi:glycosyltransferase domain-containing protein
MDLSDLTVVIPSYNRHDFLYRQFCYWSSTDAKLIFIDGSTQPITMNLQNQFKKNGNVKYIHREKSIGTRLSLAGKLITTPYTVTSNDDTFLLKSGVCAAINTLRNDPHVAACRGQSMHARLSSDKKLVKYTQSYNTFLNFIVNQKDAESRLRYVFNQFNDAASFAVLRTKVWQQSWAYGYDKKFSSTNISEFFQNIVVYIYGELICLPIPYYLSTNENPAINTTSDNRSLLFSSWLHDVKYKGEKIDFIESLSTMLSKKSTLGFKDSFKIISEGLETIHNFRSEYSIVTRLLGPKVSKKKLIKLKKLFFSKSLKKVYLITREFALKHLIDSQYVLIDRLPKTKTRSGIQLNSEQLIEIKTIERLILDFHSTKANFKI